MKKLYTIVAFIMFTCFRINAQSWSAVGGGVDNLVTSLGVYNGELYAGGFFITAGGMPVNRIAKWNGVSWSAAGSGMDSNTTVFCEYNGELYAGGFFTTAGGIPAKFIAKWNGVSWSDVGNGLNTIWDGDVNALSVYNGELYAGGYAFGADTVIDGMARWNGTTWSGVGMEQDGGLFSLAVFNGELYAGGYFNTAGGVAVNHIAKWNGVSWSAVGPNTGNERVFSLAVYNGELYAAGYFTSIGGISANNIAKWNGTTWTPVSSGMAGTINGAYSGVFAMTVYDGELYAAGRFTSAGGISANNIAKWNGTTWSAAGPGLQNNTGNQFSEVYSLSVYNGALYAGGYFTTAGGISVNNIAKWSNCISPAQPGPITGNTTANVGQTINYAIGSVSNASGYYWSLSGGGNIISGQNTTSVSVNWLVAGSHTLSVYAINSCGTSSNQALNISVSAVPVFFQKIYGDPQSNEFGGSVQQTSDGGYVIAGTGNGDFYLVKTDKDGIMKWNKTIGGVDFEYASFAKQTSDGGFILTGADDLNNYIAIIRTDSSGNVQWSKKFSTSSHDWGFSCLEATDGGFIFCGDSGEDIILFKLDINGNLLWSRLFDAGGFEEGLNLQQTSEGGFCIAGIAHFGPPGERATDGAYLIKTDGNGNLLWSKIYDLGLWDDAFDVQQCSDGGFILTGATDYLSQDKFDIYLLKTDSNGNVLWSKLYQNSGWNFSQAVEQTNDQGYLIIGNHNFGTYNCDIWVIKTNTDGSVSWSKTYGGAGNDISWRCAAGEQTNDGGYIIGGRTSSFSGSSDLYIIKTDANGNSGCNEQDFMPTVTTLQIQVIVHNTTVNESGSLLTNLMVNTASYGIESSVCNSCTSSPLQPGTISGNNPVCQGSTQIYSVNPVSGVTSYTWVLPSGWTGNSITNSITAIAGASNGEISVTASNDCGISIPQTLAVVVINTPEQPGAITGNITVCRGSSQTYSISQVNNSNSYIWTLPSGWTGNSNTTSITAIVGNDGGNISVTAYNNCDTGSNPQTLAVNTIDVPAKPGDINGIFMVDAGQTVSYLIAPVNDATGYNWSISGGGNIIGGQNTTSISVEWLTAGNYQLSVKAINTCGTGEEQKVEIIVSGKTARPFEIKILPNPSYGEVFLKAKGVVNKEIQIAIFNSAGQLVYSGAGRAGSNEYTRILDMKKMAAGTYVVSVCIENKKYFKKIIRIN